jgi:beta-exotoxin I transport system permease protein
MSAIRLVLGRDLRAHLRGLLYWLVPIAGLMIMVISIAPSMMQQGSMLEAKLQAMPEGLKRVFGVAMLDFRRPASYLAVNFVYVTLTASLSAGMLGATILAKEEALKTAELLLTQPVARSRIVAAKALVVAIHALAFNTALATIAIVGLGLVMPGPSEAGRVAQLFAGTTALAVCFGGLGMLVATLVVRARVAANAALGVVLGAYLIDVVGALSPDLDFLARVSPFRPMEPSRVIAAGGVDPIALAVLVAVGVAAAIAAGYRYARRDILV